MRVPSIIVSLVDVAGRLVTGQNQNAGLETAQRILIGLVRGA